MNIRYSPYPHRRPRPQIVNPPCSSDIPDIFRTATMAPPFATTAAVETPVVIVEEPEELPEEPSKKGKSLAQSSLRPGPSVEPERRLSTWLNDMAPSDRPAIHIAPKPVVREASPALSAVSSVGTTVVDMIPHPETDSHLWAGGWIVRGPKNYRPCP